MLINNILYIKKNIFQISIYFEKIENIEVSLLFKILKNDLIKLIDLSDDILKIKIKKNILVKIIFCDLPYLYGQFDSMKNLILINNELINDINELEKTLFHELIHYLFDKVFEYNSCETVFSEAVARYFENYYFPNKNNLKKVYMDRFDKNEFAGGYFILEYLKNNSEKNFKLILKKPYGEHKIIAEQKRLLDELIDFELTIANKIHYNMFNNIDIMLVDKNSKFLPDAYGIIFRRQEMETPMIIYIESDQLIKINTNNKIYIEKIDLPNCFSKNLLFAEIPIQSYHLIAQKYAEVCKKIPEIDHKINNETIFN